MEKTDLKKIIKGCLKGKSVFQRKLFDLFSGKMMAICYRYIDNKNEAEDVFQEAFIKVFDNLYQLKNIDSLEWWMRRIFINKALKANRQKLTISFKKDVFEIENFTDTIENVPEDAEKISAEKISEMIQELPQKAREVFNLYVIDKYKHYQIAEMLGISVGTSKSQLHDARKMLQKKIQKYLMLKKKRISL